MAKLTEPVTEEAKELHFLRFFYSEAGYAMGPADCDIYDMIKQEFMKENGYLPEGYGSEDPDYDEDITGDEPELS